MADDVESATQLTAWLVDEMGRRGRLFDATAHHPEKLAEYHQVPGVERLPRIVAVFNEFTALLDEAGRRSEFYRHIGQLAMRSRKYGITLVFAGQDFKSDLVNSRITNQVRTRVAHRCAIRYQSENILGHRRGSGTPHGGAERLTAQGRALVSLHGRVQEVQGFWVPKAWILDLAERKPRPALTNLEVEMVRFALEDLDGQFIINVLADAFQGGISKRKLTGLAKTWERWEWLTEPQHRADPRRVTEELMAAAGVTIEESEESPGAQMW